MRNETKSSGVKNKSKTLSECKRTVCGLSSNNGRQYRNVDRAHKFKSTRFCEEKNQEPPYAKISNCSFPNGMENDTYTQKLSSSKGQSKRHKRSKLVYLSRLLKSESSILSVKPQNVFPQLLENEKHFHALVKEGNFKKVVTFLEKTPNFDINCTDFQGLTPLIIAIKKSNLELVCLFLKQDNVIITDAILHAVKAGNVEVLQYVLDHVERFSPEREFMSVSSLEFSQCTTPLILAAEMGNFKIVSLLLRRGHIIPRPHKPNCFCKDECMPISKTEDQMIVANSKLHIYTAISNPVYICLTTDDPILTAFKLSKELKLAGIADVVNKAKYFKLAKDVRVFAAELAALCNTKEEVQAVLTEENGSKRKDIPYPRLETAIHYKQKEFIRSPNIQYIIEELWSGGWHSWKTYCKLLKFVIVVGRIFCLPFIFFSHCCFPTSRWADFHTIPLNKFINYLASYFLLMSLVTLQLIADKNKVTRVNQLCIYEPYLLLYTITSLLSNCVLCYRQGRSYLKFYFNRYLLTVDLVLLTTSLLWYISRNAYNDKEIIDEREKWNSFHPVILAESLFAIAAILVYFKLIMFCQMEYHLGLVLIFIRKLLKLLWKFCIIMLIILIAFTLALGHLYSFYTKLCFINSNSKESVEEITFISPYETLEFLLFGIFGLAPYKAASSALVGNESQFIEAVGFSLFIGFLCIISVFSVIMLVFMVTQSHKYFNDLKTEWLYRRTELIMHFMDLPVLPPPLNVIPTGSCCLALFKSRNQHSEFEKGLLQEDCNEEFKSIVTAQLVQRYFAKAECKKQV